MVTIRDVIVFTVVFLAFFFTPAMSNYALRKFNFGSTTLTVIIPLGLPLIAVVGFYQGDWQMGVFGLTATAGYLAGLWKFGRLGT
jgi:hypothetical protein